MQAFKETDEKEEKVVATAFPVLDLISNNRTDFFDGAYEAFPLGDVLFDLDRDPLVGVVTREIFRSSFFAIHQLFTRPGTFEFYLDVFRAVWGDDVEVEFSIPQPGVLQINIQALDVQLNIAMARRIVNNSYVYDEIILQGGDYDGDNLAFQGTQGIKTQNETDTLMFELHPAGVFVQTTLDID